MSNEDLVAPGSYSFPENNTFDLHDIVGILLRERLLSDTRFQRAKLIEVCDGAWPPTCVPMDCQGAFLDRDAPKIGYFLKTLETKDEDLIVEPHNFLHEGLRTQRELDVEEVETIFWRVKNHDSGFLLHHALQVVLDYLPKTATLRIRTGDGYALSCSPQSFIVAEVGLVPKTLLFINNALPRTVVDGQKQMAMDQYYFGEKWRTEQWVYLVFGENKELNPNRENDKCVAVDLNLSALGRRGLRGEPFAMERRNLYHNRVLPSVAEEDLELIQSPRIFARSREKAMPAIELAKRVLARLENIARGIEKYCAYCGKADPKAQCSRCRGRSKYCGAACQKKAWTYHKTWCKTDAAAAEAKQCPDVETKD